ncbi:MAG: hypothetical protein ACLUEQ_04640 [Cloacibacillus evryensis]
MALEDDLIRLFGGDRISGIWTSSAWTGESIEHPLLSKR